MLHWIRKLSSRIFFRLMYLTSPPWDSGISPPELIEFLETHPPGRAMDLGCGTGTNVITLGQYGWEVTGIDFINKAIQEAKRKVKQVGLVIDLKVGDVSNPKLYHGQYELILDIGCYHSLKPDQRNRYRQNIADHLSSKGTYLLYGFISEDDSRISSRDIASFEQLLNLRKRVDGLDGTDRNSAWFWFEPKG